MSAQQRYDQILSLFQAGLYDEAEHEISKTLRVSPHDANFLHLAGLIAEALGSLPRASMLIRRALIIRPSWFEAEYNLARLLSDQGKYDDAIELMTRASQRQADTPLIWESLANFTMLKGDLPASIAAWQKARALAPQKQEWRSHELLLRRQICDWSDLTPDLNGLLPQALTVLSDDPLLHSQVAKSYARARFSGIRPMPPASFKPHDKLRIGYLSSDFHAHATLFLMGELFALHDREKFASYVYSYGVDDQSPNRKRLKEQAEHFIDIRNLTAQAAAARIRQDEIDVLVDLKGYTRGGRLEILAYKPAPKQVHWLGYPSTLGAPFINYYIGDNVTIPQGNEKYFSEKVVRLPYCYQINDRQREIGITQVRSACGLPDTGFVLASFNQTYKITPEMFEIWCSILRELPDAVLWLYESNPYAAKALRQAAATQGIDPERLVFAKPAPLAEHMARYALVDLALDTFPYGGHTTTSDALWASTPVVTMIGQSFVSRVAASILTAAGLAELITTDKESYRSLIVDLAKNPARLRQIKRYLQSSRATMPLFDTPRFVRDLEMALMSIAMAPKE